MQPLEPYSDPKLDRRFQLWLDQLRFTLNYLVTDGVSNADIIATFPGNPSVWISLGDDIYTTQ